MKRYILTPCAKRDVNDIWDYIASDNIEAKPLQIVPVLHAARDVQSLLGLLPDVP